MEAGSEEGRTPSLRAAACRVETAGAAAPGVVAAETSRRGRERGSTGRARRSPAAGAEVEHLARPNIASSVNPVDYHSMAFHVNGLQSPWKCLRVFDDLSLF